MTGLFDPVLIYALTLLKRFLLIAGLGCMLMARFTGNPDDKGAAVFCLVLAGLLYLCVRRRR